MYNDLVKTLLKKYFGEPRKSLTVGDFGERADKAYYYTLAEEPQIAALRDLLGMKHMVSGLDAVPDLRQTIRQKDAFHPEQPQCAKYEETEKGWVVFFYEVAAVNYHKSYGGQMAATLELKPYPFITLNENSPNFFGYWQKLRSSRKRRPHEEHEGLSYWMNKALKTNDRFRFFSADFIAAVAEAEKLYIMKDVARTIRSCGCFLPPISYQNLLQFRTPAELVRSFQCGQAGPNINYNKRDLNVGYVIVMLAPEIDERDWKVLQKLDSERVAISVSLKLFYDGFSTTEFLHWYYITDPELRHELVDMDVYTQDYIQMCVEAGQKLRIGRSMNALIRAHNDLARTTRRKAYAEEMMLPLVMVPSAFDELDQNIRKTGCTEMERICTTKRLFEEGEYQSNCVFSRRTGIRRDRIAIYHWKHDGEDYTIQFGIDERKRYFIEEIKARYNREISEAHAKDLKQLLGAFCDADVQPKTFQTVDDLVRWLEVDDDALLPF